MRLVAALLLACVLFNDCAASVRQSDGSEPAPGYVLDPKLLDDVVAGLDLGELDAMDNWMAWLEQMQRRLASWLRRLAEDEESWLHRLADLIEAIGELDGSWGVLDALLIALPILTLAAIAGAVFLLWRSHRPRLGHVNGELPRLEPRTSSQPRDIRALPPYQQPPQLMLQACRALSERGALKFDQSDTNAEIVRRASIPPNARRALQSLARAADFALFGGWSPNRDELDRLHTDVGVVLGEGCAGA
jgi:hypothetical protein